MAIPAPPTAGLSSRRGYGFLRAMRRACVLGADSWPTAAVDARAHVRCLPVCQNRELTCAGGRPAVVAACMALPSRRPFTSALLSRPSLIRTTRCALLPQMLASVLCSRSVKADRLGSAGSSRCLVCRWTPERSTRASCPFFSFHWAERHSRRADLRAGLASRPNLAAPSSIAVRRLGSLPGKAIPWGAAWHPAPRCFCAMCVCVHARLSPCAPAGVLP